MLQYKYAHAETTGTTGFFKCEPMFDASWPSSFALLAKRPQDSWLRNHVLEQLSLLSEEEQRRFIDFCVLGKNPGNFFPELGKAFCDDFLKICESSGAIKIFGKNKNLNDGQECMGKTMLLCSMLNANIQQHEPIDKKIFPAYLPDFEAKKAFSAALPGGKSSGIGNWQNPGEIASLKQLAAEACRKLAEGAFLHENEMRHEAALSPINLMRQFRINACVPFGSAPYSLEGIATAYGKGLSLAKARVSCLMEIVERLSAYPCFLEDGSVFQMPQLGKLVHGEYAQLRAQGFAACFLGSLQWPENEQLYWVPGQNMRGEKIFVPAQHVFLFLNLPEADLMDLPGSTGLAAHVNPAAAKVTALLEIMERHAHASMPHNPGRCFRAASHNEILQSLLDDYLLKGIHPVFEDITTENGVPVYRCFVESNEGHIVQASAAHLNGREAAISAMLETPWPYHYSAAFAGGEATRRNSPDLPLRYLEDLPDYSTGNAFSDLHLLETLLEKSGMMPLYVDLTRQDLGFYVVRCLVPKLEINSDYDLTSPPGSALLYNVCQLLHKKSMK